MWKVALIFALLESLSLVSLGAVAVASPTSWVAMLSFTVLAGVFGTLHAVTLVRHGFARGVQDTAQSMYPGLDLEVGP